MGRRGFFAELNHQAQLAERRRRQEQQAAARQHAAAVRVAEQAQRAHERAVKAAASAAQARRQAAEKQAAALYLESRQAQVSSMNFDLERTYAEIDGILAATLAVDDYVDLESLRVTSVSHPPFDAGEDAAPIASPPEPAYPPNPVWQEPAAPSGVAAALGGRRRHEEAVAKARADYEAAVASAQHEAQRLYEDYQVRWKAWQQAEQRRQQRVADRHARYQAECEERERAAADGNTQLDRLINDLAFDVPWAIQEYVSIVLSNSVYPDSFPVEHDFRFDLDSRELTLTARVVPPSGVSTIKEYRHVKAKDEIAATMLPARDQKARYAGAVWQVAIRTMHEIFEADRAGRIRTISLTVDTTTVDPATGHPSVIPLVVVAADRGRFSQFDLANVVPDATLTHLGASMSRSPFDLVPADTSRGVRGRAR